jgi:hypothetical protein
MSEVLTSVEVCIFKPYSHSYRYYVRTDDRGLALRTVMARFDAKMLKCLNYVETKLCSPPPKESSDSDLPILDPITPHNSGERYFIGTDDSCHTYLVPETKRAEWQKWEEFQSTDSTKWSQEECDYAWTTPEYARRIDGWSSLTFTDPKDS